MLDSGAVGGDVLAAQCVLILPGQQLSMAQGMFQGVTAAGMSPTGTFPGWSSRNESHRDAPRGCPGWQSPTGMFQGVTAEIK